jgi:hypothetical protein
MAELGSVPVQCWGLWQTFCCDISHIICSSTTFCIMCCLGYYLINSAENVFKFIRVLVIESPDVI